MSHHHSGQLCPKCKEGQLRIRSGVTKGNWHYRKLECNRTEDCDFTAETSVPADSVWRRSKKSSVHATA